MLAHAIYALPPPSTQQEANVSPATLPVSLALADLHPPASHVQLLRVFTIHQHSIPVVHAQSQATMCLARYETYAIPRAQLAPI